MTVNIPLLRPAISRGVWHFCGVGKLPLEAFPLPKPWKRLRFQVNVAKFKALGPKDLDPVPWPLRKGRHPVDTR